MTPQIVELERKLEEAEHKKQQAELEREMAIKEMETQKKFQMQLHSQLGKCKYEYELFEHVLIIMHDYLSDTLLCQSLLLYLSSQG